VVGVSNKKVAEAIRERVVQLLLLSGALLLWDLRTDATTFVEPSAINADVDGRAAMASKVLNDAFSSAYSLSNATLEPRGECESDVSLPRQSTIDRLSRALSKFEEVMKDVPATTITLTSKTPEEQQSMDQFLEIVRYYSLGHPKTKRDLVGVGVAAIRHFKEFLEPLSDKVICSDSSIKIRILEHHRRLMYVGVLISKIFHFSRD
jgi:hypothetical protein